MPLRKEKDTQHERPSVRERQIEAIINKGGRMATDIPKKGRQQNYPLYFLQDDMRARIDAAIEKAGGVKPQSVNEWINRAILDKLSKEE